MFKATGRHALALTLPLLAVLSAAPALAEDRLAVKRVDAKLGEAPLAEDVWKNASPPYTASLMAQPMFPPRPATTTTPEVKVQAVHDGEWMALRLKWKDTEKSEAGHLGEFSDAVAVMFPVHAKDSPPAIFMGSKGDPTHIFHWRAQYQRDKERGKPTMKDLYANMNPDMYPLEPKDPGSVGEIPKEARESFQYGVAAGNPQSYIKNGVDEIVAEGYGTSAVMEERASNSNATWANGEWTVVIARALKREKGSILDPGGQGFAAFAVWQGGADEVGSRKSLTMAWLPLTLDK
jgi:hypothetical protein